ncbi:MAG TPA: hemolysin family protein [Anaerolineaceae bacterium]|jgi:putative hemolysin|nr:HlyC/CorC family transporter [Chloroflexota bacterium]HNS07883.1 hemolysin family protein [Anaerolineaceae bacterium]HNW13713.1 hemolysin family protein [Anaerolineaceae bacterium]HOE02808.1 hemolysin family protein [Anaerolineaceae bacterium]HOQ69376.1 hemolysin family protein [Anaerolineaceae bacterium]
MSNTLIEILVIFVLILFNGFFSMSEIAIVSARKVRLEQRADEGDAGAGRALQLSKETGQFLSSVQVGITLVAMLTGAFGGATLAERLTQSLARVPWLATSAATLSLVIVVLVTTYFSLVIGELIPKKIALNNPEKIASKVSGIMVFFSRLTSPLTRLLSSSTDLGMRLLGIKPSGEPPITEEEIKVLIDQGTQVGVFGEAEQDMVEGIFRLNDRSINAIMTPRTDVTWLDADDSIEEILKTILQSPYSRFPVSRESLDNVLGILKSRDLLEKQLSGEPFNLLDLLQKPLFIPENTPVMRVLEMEREHGVHEALVIDEYGGVLGFVTLFDVLEAIIGELPSQDQASEPEIVMREDGSYLIDGLLPIDEFKDLFDLDLLPEEDKVGFQTAGGFVMNQVGSIPHAGQTFQWNDLLFEVLDMDGLRIDKILVSRNSEKTPPAGGDK